MRMKVPKVEIAIKVGISRSTLYEELKRGTVAQKTVILVLVKNTSLKLDTRKQARSSI